MVYIDLNMVRAGVINHPREWKFCGYHEIMNPKKRYSIVDRKMLMMFCRFKSNQQLLTEYDVFVNRELAKDSCENEPNWSKGVAVGSEAFIIEVQEKLGMKVEKRKIDRNEDHWVLHETEIPYK